MAKIVKHYYLNELNPESMEIMIDITDSKNGLRAYSFNMDNIGEISNDNLTLNTSIMFLMSNSKDVDNKFEIDIKVSRNGLRALTKQDVSKWDKCILVTEEKDSMNSEFIEYLYDSMNDKVRNSEDFKLFNDENKRKISNLEYTEKLRLQNKVKDVEFLLNLKLKNMNSIVDSNTEKEYVEKSSYELRELNEKMQLLTNEIANKTHEVSNVEKELEEKFAYIEMVEDDIKSIDKKRFAAEDSLKNKTNKIERMQIEIDNKIEMLGIPYRPKGDRYKNTTIYKINNGFKIYRGSTVRENNKSGFISTESEVYFNNLGEMIEFITDGRGDGVWERGSY